MKFPEYIRDNQTHIMVLHMNTYGWYLGSNNYYIEMKPEVSRY
jgi:hypothetical protein